MSWSAGCGFYCRRVTASHSGQRGVGGKPRNSPHARTPAQTSRRHRLPRAREPLYGEPQDCSDDSAAGQCARLMHHPVSARLRYRWQPSFKCRSRAVPMRSLSSRVVTCRTDRQLKSRFRSRRWLQPTARQRPGRAYRTRRDFIPGRTGTTARCIRGSARPDDSWRSRRRPSCSLPRPSRTFLRISPLLGKRRRSPMSYRSHRHPSHRARVRREPLRALVERGCDDARR